MGKHWKLGLGWTLARVGVTGQRSWLVRSVSFM